MPGAEQKQRRRRLAEALGPLLLRRDDLARDAPVVAEMGAGRERSLGLGGRQPGDFVQILLAEGLDPEPDSSAAALAELRPQRMVP
jgi:hypothetical protein